MEDYDIKIFCKMQRMNVPLTWCDQMQYAEICRDCDRNKKRPRSKFQNKKNKR